MTIIPFDCIWHDTYVEVFQTDGERKFDHGIYDLISGDICDRCGNPNLWDEDGETKCYEQYLHKKLKDIDGVFQLGYYYKMAALSFRKENDILTGHILEIKKQFNLIYAKPLAKAIYLAIKNRYTKLMSADIIVPVPNHSDDFNFQAKAVALANELAAQFQSNGKNIEVVHAIKKVINESTHGLSRDEKEMLVESGMFEFDINKSVRNKNVILVDDILTNGIIKGKCASILRTNGAAKIWGFVAGRNFTVPV